MIKQQQYFDARSALSEVLNSVVNDETVVKLLDALDKSGAAVLMPTKAGNLYLQPKEDTAKRSVCLWSPDGLGFMTKFNIITAFGERRLSPGTSVYMHAVGKGRASQEAFNGKQ